jgi:predicted ArsR family transcriptional regulator
MEDMDKPRPHLDELNSLAMLSESARRRLFDYVSSQRDAVSRDQAASALGMTRSLAAFHLDRLADAGLLDIEFRRLSGRTGPGAGRPSKLYRRSSVEIEASIPPRRYRMAAGWLADAFGQDVPAEALRESARAHGEELGRRAHEQAASDDREVLVAAGIAVLNQEGFGARQTDDGRIVLDNCPFDAIAREHRELVCGEMNRALFEGFAAGLDAGRFQAVLEPRPGACCMVVR